MGAMRVLWRSGLINVAMRLALYFDLLKREDLDTPEPPVFGSLEEFRCHHDGDILPSNKKRATPKQLA